MHEHLLLHPVVEMFEKKNVEGLTAVVQGTPLDLDIFLIMFSVFMAQHRVLLKRYWSQVT